MQQSPRWTKILKISPSPYLAVAGLFFTVISASPTKIKNEDFRSAKKALVIRLHQNSPAFSAFQDLGEAKIQELNKAKVVTSASRSMRVGALSPTTLKKLLVEQPQESVQVKMVALKGLRISKDQPQQVAVTTPSVSRDENLRPEPEILIEQDLNQQLVDQKGRLKTLAERKAAVVQYINPSELQAPSWRNKLAELIARTRPQPVDEAKTQNNITYVAAPKVPNGWTQAATKKSQTKATNPEAIEYHPEQAASVVADAYSVAAYKNVSRPSTLSGSIELADGLAIVQSEVSLRLYHSKGTPDGGNVKMWLDEGRFEMGVSELDGYVVAELRDRNNKMIGLGEVDLASLPQIPYPNDEVKNLKVKIRSYSESLEAEISSIYSQGTSRVEVQMAKLTVTGINMDVPMDSEGRYRTDVFYPKSHVVLSASAPGHVSTMQLGVAGKLLQFILYPEKWIESLLNMVNGSKLRDLQRSGMIIGQVEINGRPVEGARIEVAGDGMPQAVYFQSVFPNRKLTETSENGKFVIAGLDAGFHAVRAFYRGQYFPVEIIPVDTGHVTNYTLTDPGYKNVEIETVDVHPAVAAESEINITAWGSEDKVQLLPNEKHTIQIPAGNGLMIVENEPTPELEVVRMTWPRNENKFVFPRVERQWLSSLLQRGRVSLSPGAGLVLGFLNKSDDEIQISDKNGLVFYFDKNGQGVKETNPTRFGYVVFNLVPGPQQIFVQPSNGPARAHLLVVDQGVTNVILENNQN